MKKLTCEMCGGTDLLKQGGVFVCQSCGTKYSVEEAKKMMVEGTVEVQGIVQVANTAQLDNLLKLAQSAYESKNYAKAEEFCNQIIAMDSSCYEAWKLKGEAINYQISLTNDRITEVYNCIMTSYRVLDEAGKEKHREEVLKALRECLEGEITFVLKQFIENRPSENLLMKVTTTFANCGANIVSSYEELGYSPEETEAYKVYIRNFFIKGVNAACNSSWDNVYYRYYRNGFTEEYRPDADILTHYMLESEYLLKLLRFAEAMFDAETDPVDKDKNYVRQNIICNKLLGAESYKRMVKTTTNGYGAVVSREEYWQLDKAPTEETKAKWRKEISRTYELSDKTEVEIARQDPVYRENKIQECKKKLVGIDVNYVKHNLWSRIWIMPLAGILLMLLLDLMMSTLYGRGFRAFDWEFLIYIIENEGWDAIYMDSYWFDGWDILYFCNMIVLFVVTYVVVPLLYFVDIGALKWKIAKIVSDRPILTIIIFDAVCIIPILFSPFRNNWVLEGIEKFTMPLLAACGFVLVAVIVLWLVPALLIFYVLDPIRKRESENKNEVAYLEKRIQEFENAAENVEEEEKNAYV